MCGVTVERGTYRLGGTEGDGDEDTFKWRRSRSLAIIMTGLQSQSLDIPWYFHQHWALLDMNLPPGLPLLVLVSSVRFADLACPYPPTLPSGVPPELTAIELHPSKDTLPHILGHLTLLYFTYGINVHMAKVPHI